MTVSNDELAEQLKEQLMAGDRELAFDDAPSDEPFDENPLETDFFKALNAYRAAKHGGDPDAISAAEANLQSVVREELTGGSREA